MQSTEAGKRDFDGVLDRCFVGTSVRTNLGFAPIRRGDRLALFGIDVHEQHASAAGDNNRAALRRRGRRRRRKSRTLSLSCILMAYGGR
jgi:hypothetical protein